MMNYISDYIQITGLNFLLLGPDFQPLGHQYWIKYVISLGTKK